MAYKLARGHTSGGHGHDQPVLSVSHEHALLEKLHHLAARCPRVAGLLLGSAHLQEAKRRVLQYNTVMTIAHTSNATVRNIHAEKDIMMYIILYYNVIVDSLGCTCKVVQRAVVNHEI